MSFPTASDAKTPVPVDGTGGPNQEYVSVTGQAMANWTPGAALWLVWTMVDATGKGQGLAIDNLSFSATARPSLTIQAMGTNMVLSWPNGYLQSSSNVAGPFTTLMDIASPFTNVLAGACRFYRVVVPYTDEHKYDDVRCEVFGLGLGARRAHPPEWGCNRRATTPQAKNIATLRAAILFAAGFVARSSQTRFGYARRSRLACAKNASPRTSSYLCSSGT